MFKFIFKSSFFAYMLAALAIQQAAVGLSNYFLAQSASQIFAGSDARWSLLWFFSSLLFPFWPGTISLVTLKKWSLSLRSKAIWFVESRLFSQVGIWTNQNSRQEKTALLTSESQIVIADVCHFSYEVLATVLNYAFNLLAIGYLVHYSVSLAFVFGMMLSSVMANYCNRYINLYAELMEEAKTQVSEVLHVFWDNIVLGNLLHRNRWVHNLEKSLKSLDYSTLRHEYFTKGASLFLVHVSSLPMFLVLAYRLFTPGISKAELFIAAAMLPRMLQMIQSSHVLFSLTTEFSSLKSRVRSVHTRMFQLSSTEIKNRIDLDKITLQKNGVTQNFTGGLEGLCKYLIDARTGYFTIRGPNGAGKSSILLFLKNSLREKAVHIPNQNHLLLSTQSSEVGSSGEMQLTRLKDVFAESVEVYLLDEWDANLDRLNRVIGINLIHDATQESLVVDVLHSQLTVT